MTASLAENIRRDKTVLVFNMDLCAIATIREDQPIQSQSQKLVVELDDMTDEQKKIIAASQTIAGSFPTGLSKEQLMVWMEGNLFHK